MGPFRVLFFFGLSVLQGESDAVLPQSNAATELARASALESQAAGL
jgi:hypothetical protein